MAGFNTDLFITGNARDLCPKKIFEMAKRDEDVVFVVSDMTTTLGVHAEFQKLFPKRYIDVGIAEDGGVGITAGLALAGKKPFFIAFGPFLSLRTVDQIHTDIAYNGMPVRLIGTHGGMTSGGGPTHYTISEYGIMRAIPKMTMVAPADANQCVKVLEAALDYPDPMYIRIARGSEPLVYESQDYDYQIGTAITVKEGKDATLIGTGIGVFNSLTAAIELEKCGIDVRVIDMHTIKPLDMGAVLKAAAETGAIMTVEDHNIYAGLGGAVAEVLAESNIPCKFKRLGIPNEFPPLGYAEDLYKYYEFDGIGIAKQLKALLGK